MGHADRIARTLSRRAYADLARVEERPPERPLTAAAAWIVSLRRESARPAAPHVSR